jgi:branched-chain amino acid transport system permease protein
MTIRNLAAGAAVLALLAVLGALQGNYGVYVLSTWVVFAIAAMGLNLTLGYAGQLSMAQAAFVGLGAYTTTLMMANGIHWSVGALASMALSFVVGLALGYPAMRVQHHMLAFVTLAFGTILYLVFRNEEWLTGGVYGLSGIQRPSFFGISLASAPAFYWFLLGVLGITMLVVYGLLRSPWGRAFKALRENPIRANSLGLDVRAITLLAFAIGSSIGGLAGALFAPLIQFIEPNSFNLAVSLELLLMVVIGGVGSFWGPLIGAALVLILPEYLRFTEGYYLIIYAALVIVLMAVAPSGITGLIRTVFNALTKGRQVRADLKNGAKL